VTIVLSTHRRICARRRSGSGAAGSFDWGVRSSAWRSLRTGFPHQKYANDLAQQNIELKWHLAKHWASAALDEKIRIATWIVSDWGGIRRNSEMTILGYVNQADAERPATPFAGISSYSKILAIKDPDRYAVFDARVAASINAIQLLGVSRTRLKPSDLLTFAIPAGRNSTVTDFRNNDGSLASLARRGFTLVETDSTYATYLRLLSEVKCRVGGLSLLQIEMVLFARAPALCDDARRATLETERS
jgi:hypothetical protein